MTTRHEVRAVTLAVIMLLSVLAFVPTASADDPSDVPDDQVFNATDQVGVWERAMFPLRQDGRDAATRITPPDVVVREVGTMQDADLVFSRGSNTKDYVGIYEKGDTFDYDFVDGRANTNLSGQENVEIVAARFKESGGSSTVPSTFSEAMDLLTKSNANQNATFFEVANDESLNSDGELSKTSAQLPSGGHRVLYFAVREPGKEGFDINGGQIDGVEGNVTIIGVTGFSTQRAGATVGVPQSVNRGKSISFQVNSQGAFDQGDDVTHAVVLYEEDTFTNSEQRIIVDSDEIDENFDIETDTELETTIGETVGVADVEDGITINGEDISDGRVARSVGPEAAIDFVAEDLGTGSPDVTRVGDESTLYASVTAKAGEDPTASIEVDTFSNFSTGTYRWVYVGKLDDNDSAITSATGTLSIKEPSQGQPSHSRSNDRAGQPSGTSASVSGSAQASVNSVGRQTTVNIQGAQPGDSVTVQREEQEVASEVQRHGSALESLQTTFTGETDFDMQITQSNNKPDPSAPDPPSEKGTVGYINVEHAASDDAVGEVRFNFRVTQERLDERGIDRDEVVLYRYSGGEWTTLETEFVGLADDGTPRFQAVSPGLSVFAIGSGPAQQQTTPTSTPTETTTDEPPETTPTTPTAGPPTNVPVQEPGGFGGTSLAALLVALLAVVALGGAYWYRQQR